MTTLTIDIPAACKPLEQPHATKLVYPDWGAYERSGVTNSLSFLPALLVSGAASQIAVAAYFRPENAEAIFGVGEGDPLDEAGEDFLGR
jgi:hypothetical protein